MLGAGTYYDLYKTMVSVCHDPCSLVKGSCEPANVFSSDKLRPNISSLENSIMALDASSYLPDDILAKVDRAAMANSLETRIPLLDHRIVEFAFRLPIDIKSYRGVSKWPLRKILYKYIPCNLIERPKKGFSVPLAHWLRNELKEWTCDLLGNDQIKKDGIINANMLQRYLMDHMNNKQDYSRILWSLLMFQCWLHNK